MRPAKPSLQDRLRKGASAFEFGALLEGVSTIEEPGSPPKRSAPMPGPVSPPEPPSEAPDGGLVAAEDSGPASHELVQAAEHVATGVIPANDGSEIVAAGAGDEVRSAPTDPGMTATDAVVEAAAQDERTTEPEPFVVAEEAGSGGDRDHLRALVGALTDSLLAELTALRAALHDGDPDLSGSCIGRVNQALELLNAADPEGDLARRLGLPASPPRGRAWPMPVWTVAEFTHSPLSGLLPEYADDRFVWDVFQSACGASRQG